MVLVPYFVLIFFLISLRGRDQNLHFYNVKKSLYSWIRKLVSFERKVRIFGHLFKVVTGIMIAAKFKSRCSMVCCKMMALFSANLNRGQKFKSKVSVSLEKLWANFY